MATLRVWDMKNGGIMGNRKSEYAVLPLILNRWSPRAMSGQPITESELLSLFEAVRWAPSSHNNQPWRFVYVRRNTPDWDRMFKLLVPANQMWAKNAAVLILAISHKTCNYNGKVARTHSLDTGAAMQNVALQAFSMDLACRGMEGFDYEKARKEFSIPEEYAIEAMYAIGHRGNSSDLPAELQAKESPSDRKKINEFAFEGNFKVKKE